MFWPLSIVPMLTCRQTDIFGTTLFVDKIFIWIKWLRFYWLWENLQMVWASELVKNQIIEEKPWHLAESKHWPWSGSTTIATRSATRRLATSMTIALSRPATLKLHPFTEQRLHEHHYHQPQLPSHHPQEQSKVQSQEVPVRVREWRVAETAAV